MAQAELSINITAKNQSKAAFASVKRDIQGIKSSFADVAKFAGGNLLAAGLQAGVRAMTGAVRGMVGSFAAMSKEAADFNAQISNIGAVMGGTADELKQLKDLASDLGVDPNLKVSATEAAAAIEMLARNGLKLPDILGGATKATVLLANATGAEFTTAADIATDAMAVFGISAKDMIDAVDGITSVTTNSKFTIDDYALAIAQGGGVASSAGVSFEDFNAYVAATAQYFKSGSDSGTAFKTFLMRLNPQTKEAGALMQSLGLLTADGANAFFDSNGQMKDMAEIAGILNKTFAGMTEQQRLNTLTTLFGTDAYRSAYGLMQLTEEEFRSLQATMAKTDATKAAAVRMDNLAGDMEIFQGVVDSLRIQIGDEFDPALRQMFQAATSTLSMLQPVIVGFANKIGQGFAGGIQDVRDYKAEFDQLFSFFGEDRTSGMLAAIGKLTGAQVDVPIGKTTVEVDWGGLKASFDRATTDLSLSIGDLVTGTFNLTDYTTTLQIGDFFTGTINLKERIASVSIGDFFAGAQIGTGGKITLTFNETDFTIDFMAIKDTVLAQLSLLKTGIMVGVMTLNFSTISEIVSSGIKELPGKISESVGGLTTFNFSSVAESVANRLKALPAAISAKLGLGEMDFTAIANTVGEAMRTGINLIFGETGIMTEMSGFINSTLDTVSASLDSVDATALGLKLSLSIGSILAVIGMVASVSIDSFAERFASITGAVTSVTTFLGDFAAGIDTTALTEAVSGFAENFGTTVKDTLSDPTLLDLGESVGSFVKGIVAKIGETLSTPGFGQDLGEGAGDALAGIATGAMNIATGVFAELGKIDWGQFAGDASAFTQGFVAGVANSIATADMSPIAWAFIDATSGALANLAQLPGQVLMGQANEANPLKDSTWADTPTWVSDLMGWTPVEPAWTNDPIPVAQPTPPDPSFWPTIMPPPAGFFPQVEKPGWKIDPPVKPTWVDVMSGIVSAFGGAVNRAASVTAGVGGNGSGGGRGGFGGNAKGTDNWEGGWTWVGEEGPELLNLPKGAQILSNPESKKMIGQLADGTTTAPAGGAFGGFAKLLGFATSVIGNSINDMSTQNEQLDATVAENTAAVESAKAATDAAAAATTAAQASTAVNTGTLATTGELIRVSAEQFAMAANDSGSYVLNGIANFTDSFSDLLDSFGDGLESALQNVPGLFGTSEVTADQMKLGEMGIPQNFADDYVRRLTDEVLNGVDWDGVDISDAATRAGIDPGLPAKTILEMFKQKWNDKSLFADPKNLDLINLDAVQASLEQQAAMQLGGQNLMGLFGITPEQAQAQGATAGASVGTGMLSGISTAVAGGDAGTGLAASLSEGITEESMAGVSASVVSGLTAEMGKAEYGDQMAGAVSSLFTNFLENAEALKSVAQSIMEKVAGQFATVTGLDMVSKFAESFSTQLNTTTAKESLAKVGEKILELVYDGYLGAAEEKNWAEGVNAKPKDPPTTGTTTTTPTPPGNAVGTSNWRGGLTWVGETGAELVNLPRGSRIYNNSDSMELLGAGGGNINVTINATVADGIDVERLAHRVADVIRSRRR
jgi:TP901 family phage tail tape measure protein